MIFTQLPLKGAYLIEPELLKDERGWFARAFCAQEFARHGLCAEYVQHNSSFNAKKGTVRGMHFQRPPHEEVKVVRCARGAIFDVIVDVRENSDTYLKWRSVELTEDDGKMLYIPKGFAHGFQTLADNTEVFYLMGEFYRSGFEAGLRWDDKQLNINWPLADNITISEKDKRLPTVGELSH